MGKDKDKDKEKDKNKKIRICKKCSGIDADDLEDKVKSKHIKVGCIDKCQKKEPKLKGKVYGYIDDEFVVCDTKKEFISKI